MPKIPRPDLNDGLALAGLILAEIGLWQLNPWASVVLLGLLLMAAGLRGVL